MGEIQIVKNYRDDDALRHSFNRLAGKTFDLDFEDWYQNGFWEDQYIPYSVVLEGQVVANVSVNVTDMRWNGGTKHFLQLGTVMTEKSCRCRGYIRRLIEQIEADYGEKTEGIYLFANDSVMDFYPRFGFQKSREYQYSGQLANTGVCQYQPVAMDCPAAWRRLEKTMERSAFRGRFDLVGNRGLPFFYVTKFLRDNVFYHAPSDSYVIAEREGGNLFLHSVYSGTLTELPEILALFGEEIRQVTLGFVPAEKDRYTAKELLEEDSTLFVKGSELGLLEREKLRIPSLAHA